MNVFTEGSLPILDGGHLLDPGIPLTAGHAVAALIVQPDGHFLLQLRDEISEIFYPGHWGLFGGGVEPDEDDQAALTRELEEELGFRVTEAEPFVRFDFDLAAVGQGRIYRQFFVVFPGWDELREMTLGEGKAKQAFSPEDVLLGKRVVPYDAFAIWLFACRGRLLASEGWAPAG